MYCLEFIKFDVSNASYYVEVENGALWCRAVVKKLKEILSEKYDGNHVLAVVVVVWSMDGVIGGEKFLWKCGACWERECHICSLSVSVCVEAQSFVIYTTQLARTWCV